MSKEALAAVRVGVDDALSVFESLSAEEWSRPSGCTGWRVQDVAAHMSSNFKETADPSPSASEPLPPLPAERLMDLLVAPRLEWTPEQVLTELRTYARRLVEALDALQEPPLATSPLTLADLGTYEMHQLADAYAFDLYCHLRVDVLAPRGQSSANSSRPMISAYVPQSDGCSPAFPRCRVAPSDSSIGRSRWCLMDLAAVSGC